MMFYDYFLNNEHSDIFQKILVKFNLNIVNYLYSSSSSVKNGLSILEVGPGKGYFFNAIQKSELNINYSAVDRNENILKNLGIKSIYKSDLPSLPVFNKKFDIIYVSYVVEHLKNGREIFDFLSECYKYLKINGRVVLFVPNALRQKMEFWNIDYTHIYPTTKRNMTMALIESGFGKIISYDINGLLTYKYFTNYFLYKFVNIILYLYNYKFFQELFLIFNFPKSNINDFFYKIYCFAKEENLMIVAEKN